MGRSGSESCDLPQLVLLLVALAHRSIFIPSLGELARLHEIGTRQHLSSLAPGHHFARQNKGRWEMSAHLAKIVECGNHRAAFGVPSLDQLNEIGNGLFVDGAERLVEQNDGGILEEQAREQHALELTT